jgi:hypothetical protein
MNLTAEQLQIASMIDGKMQKLVCNGNDDLKVELALWTFMNQIKPTFLSIVIAVIYLSTNVAGYSQGAHSKFEAALKKELLRNHQRHVPVVTVKGSEVRLTYGPELEWAKSSAHDDVARMDALDCLKADYAALKADPKHQLHDYFHVINYSMWSHQVIGEATVNRSDYPSAEAVDEEIARTLAEWQRRATAGSPR